MTYGDIGVAGRGGILQFSSKLRMADLLGLASLLPPQGEETRLRFEIGDCDNMDPINAHVEIRERAIQGDRLAICRCVKKLAACDHHPMTHHGITEIALTDREDERCAFAVLRQYLIGQVVVVDKPVA